MHSNNLVVAILDGDGNIRYSQPFEEFKNGKRNIEILNFYTGQKLFDILVDEVGAIKYEDNRVALKLILESNLNNSAMKLLGKVAELYWLESARKVMT